MLFCSATSHPISIGSVVFWEWIVYLSTTLNTLQINSAFQMPARHLRMSALFKSSLFTVISVISIPDAVPSIISSLLCSKTISTGMSLS